MAEKLNFDVEQLTLDDIEELEEHIGTAFDSIFDAGRPRAKALKYIAFILKRRDNPDFTLEDAGKLTISFEAPNVDPPGATAS